LKKGGTLGRQQPPPPLGSRLANGRYLLLAVLGRGRMGLVYRAEDELIGRQVALKIIYHDLTQRPGIGPWFQQEADKVAQLRHPHILPIYDRIWDEKLQKNLVIMKLVLGGTLAEKLDQGPLEPGQVVTMTAGIAAALTYAHSQGVLHRDLKPANILLDNDDWPLVSDFAGVVIGTPAYFSPEQGRNLPLDGRTDVYSLGIIAYEMLAGHRPFGGPTVTAFIDQHVNASIPPLGPAVAPALEAVVQKALAKEPAERYQTPQALAEALAVAVRS
jgi:eukaryotic-like serine/threonine-protein kinase